MDLRLDGKVAVITGGGSGIGQAISQAFAGAGAQVYIFEMAEEQSQQTVKAIQASGGQASFLKVDISHQAETIAAVEKVIAASGRVDILVNNAGIAHIGKLENTPEADFDRVYGVNVKGVYNGMLAVVEQMKKQNGGVILNMASIASVVGIPDRFAYSMSKGAVLTMTYSVARDYVAHNIRCNAIAPARVHTPFVDGFIAKHYPGQEEAQFDRLAKTQPIGRMGKPEEVAGMALYLCSDQATFITGTNFPIDGGFIKLNT
jgi:2-keto-3-deoxy-L-fuconate dehydrogenase